MSISKSVEYVPKVIRAGDLRRGLTAALEATGVTFDPATFTVMLQRGLPDGSRQDLPAVYLSELDAICDLSDPGLTISGQVGGFEDRHYFGIFGGPAVFARVNVSTPAPEAGRAMIDSFMAATGLVPYVPVPTPSVDDDKLEAPLRQMPDTQPERRLRAFLSYRFGAAQNSQSARLIERFLELLNVEVLTGQSYEPRPIQDKVSDRLRGLDFLVLFIGEDGQSSWTRDEIATAHAGGVPVVPIVMDGSEFEQGLFGNQEYVTVSKGHVGDAFLPLLEAVVYVRRTQG